jgi:SAM-dependent methyltransferase
MKEFMEPGEAYNQWAQQYDTNINKTRDLEALALRTLLDGRFFEKVLEMGCGTGKNTAWLQQRTQQITSVDLSEGMLALAKEKIKAPHVHFVQADMNDSWHFAPPACDLVCFSLVLEHIENLENVFSKAADCLKNGGWLYLGELHPFKQYMGSKARFEDAGGTQVVTCFTHHISDFTRAAHKAGLELKVLEEFFDGEQTDGPNIPRILALVFQKVSFAVLPS